MRHKKPPLLLIGASAGGPGMIAELLSRIPIDFPASIIIVQHFDYQLYKELQTWLQTRSTLPIHGAERMNVPQSGAVYLPTENKHLLLNAEGAFMYQSAKESESYVPAIDRLFHSAVPHAKGRRVCAVILTGMGSDGAEGLLQLKNAGARTIAQLRTEAVVSGMPAAALKRGAAQFELSIAQISEMIVQFFKGAGDE